MDPPNCTTEHSLGHDDRKNVNYHPQEEGPPCNRLQHAVLMSHKNVFQLHGVDERDKTVLQKKLSRHKVLAFVAKLPAGLIAMEASGGPHYWAREFTK